MRIKCTDHTDATYTGVIHLHYTKRKHGTSRKTNQEVLYLGGVNENAARPNNPPYSQPLFLLSPWH